MFSIGETTRQVQASRNDLSSLRGAGLVVVALSLLVFFGGAGPARAADGFGNLVHRLSPAVVNITIRQKQSLPEKFRSLPEDSPLREFFDDEEGEGRAMTSALGSGFVIDPSGVIVTNNHVIDGADEISVVFADGETLDATLLGHDENTDLAVLKVDSSHPLPSVHFGNSDDLRVGDWVVAIGNPFGLGGSVTSGIVSALHRAIYTRGYTDFIQTDAAINKGNSGGPLFDMQGHVIGINTAIISPSGDTVGIGFALPSSTAKAVVDDLIHFGEVHRGWLGVRVLPLTRDLAHALQAPPDAGVAIANVMVHGPAQEGGLRVGDVVTSYDGMPVGEVRDLLRRIAETRARKRVEVGILRGGKPISVRLTVGELQRDEAGKDETDGAAPEKKTKRKPVVPDEMLGLDLVSLTPEVRSAHHVPLQVNGVVVAAVANGGAADGKGIRAGDVIVEVNREAVDEPDDVRRAVREARRRADGGKVLLRIYSNGRTRFFAIDVSPS
ncbi:Do family serine endopeptidase [Parvibaculum sp.]|uniref:Do family serine endopeptidase n=1 Tax=Parvibaculum sp. TaxID=2024848 RepID=UPI0025DF770D|nr:Do family serine endopeptidase [Parvibaculum sp.]